MSVFIKETDGVTEYSREKQGKEVFRDVDSRKEFNFKVVEFACKDGSDFLKVDSGLVFMLQQIREHFAKPVVINSAYRNSAYNKKVGGAPRSQHIYGKAADICINGVSPLEIAQYVERECKLIKGIGLYTWGVHVDTRTNPYKWDSRSGKETPVDTFLEKATKDNSEKVDIVGNVVFHDVKAGETVWGICDKYKITLKDFRALNPTIKNIALIYPGQKVRIK